MSDEEYIRKAVELADGFKQRSEGFIREFDDSGANFINFYLEWPELEDELRFGLDALAAQLVRQVDALGPNYAMQLARDVVCVDIYEPEGPRLLAHAQSCIDGPNRTMNTIRAIVDSKVLE